MSTAEERLSKLEAEIGQKADKKELEKKQDKSDNKGFKADDPNKLVPGETDSKEWKVTWKEIIEFIVVTKTLSIIKATLIPTIFDGGKTIEYFLEKKLNIKRTDWGLLWKKATPAQTPTMEDIERLTRGLRNANKRIDPLERKMREVRTRQNVTRQNVRHGDTFPSGGNDSARIHDLELRVANLVRALG
ncbi:hypothetical protein [Streptomyces sp. UNOB3_S3]|uniref:hypothetical protein n=1 Tax=Streptomyces sp. UNOB3_S3 TaxID=2871682 RepID=UPI001E4795FA|nr:hypothetical protein [Streptomyces sp. UNOB3_S3]MCC3776624.1 hypothetical protein [Streptomyces sp. UNOB3_S3]